MSSFESVAIVYSLRGAPAFSTVDQMASHRLRSTRPQPITSGQTSACAMCLISCGAEGGTAGRTLIQIVRGVMRAGLGLGCPLHRTVKKRAARLHLHDSGGPAVAAKPSRDSRRDEWLPDVAYLSLSTGRATES